MAAFLSEKDPFSGGIDTYLDSLVALPGNDRNVYVLRMT